MDLKRLKVLLGDDEKMVAKFLTIFKNEIPKQLAQLSRTIKKKEWESASIIAHGIKSQSKYLDLKAMVTIAYAIEKDAESERNLDRIPARFKKLERGLLSVVRHL